MAFKKMENNLGFADFALASSLKHNRSFKLMEKIKNSIEWQRIEAFTSPTIKSQSWIYRPLAVAHSRHRECRECIHFNPLSFNHIAISNYR